ncbi:MAG: cupin domain-containing protein [Halioglobus sp.]
MKKCLILLIFLSEFLYAESFDAIRMEGSEFTWKKVAQGVWVANITGDDDAEGMYVQRVKLEKGQKSDRHYHHDVKVVTVLSGSIFVGFPEEDGEWDVKRLGVGGVYTEPRNQPHFVWAKDEDVVVQVVGYGPTSKTSLDTSDSKH